MQTFDTKASESTEMFWALTAREAAVAAALDEKYRERYGQDPAQDPNLIYHLGDSTRYCNWSGCSGRLPTLRKSSGIMWSPCLQRAMTSREKLASLGFPVTRETAGAMQVPQLPVLDVARASKVAGNCMHWTAVGVAQLVALCCFAPKSQ